jgi:hypothetical protein
MLGSNERPRRSIRLGLHVRRFFLFSKGFRFGSRGFDPLRRILTGLSQPPAAVFFKSSRQTPFTILALSHYRFLSGGLPAGLRVHNPTIILMRPRVDREVPTNRELDDTERGYEQRYDEIGHFISPSRLMINRLVFG